MREFFNIKNRILIVESTCSVLFFKGSSSTICFSRFCCAGSLFGNCFLPTPPLSNNNGISLTIHKKIRKFKMTCQWNTTLGKEKRKMFPEETELLNGNFPVLHYTPFAPDLSLCSVKRPSHFASTKTELQVIRGKVEM